MEYSPATVQPVPSPLPLPESEIGRVIIVTARYPFPLLDYMMHTADHVLTTADHVLTITMVWIRRPFTSIAGLPVKLSRVCDEERDTWTF